LVDLLLIQPPLVGVKRLKVKSFAITLLLVRVAKRNVAEEDSDIIRVNLAVVVEIKPTKLD